MMRNFTYNISTKIHFGKGQISHLAELRESGTKALIVYGGGSVKRNGILDDAVRILAEAGVETVQLGGVEPNPRVETVRKGAALCREQGLDMVLAIGGGSTIDCSKMIAAAAKYDGDAWDLVLDSSKIRGALPIYAVLTMAATGSEMDPIAVISDMSCSEKWGSSSDWMRPKMSVLDPEYTYTVPRKHTAAGTADIMSHTLENYFTNVEHADLQKNLAEGILRTVIHYGPIALENPRDYDARANLMWCSSMAINGLIKLGAEVGWCVHPMEHEFSAFYDITHGEGLAVLTPVWMRYVMEVCPGKTAAFARYGRKVWDITLEDDAACAEEAVKKTEQFLFEELGLPRTLRECGVPDEDIHFVRMAQKIEKRLQTSFCPLTLEDTVEIFRRAL